MGVVRRQSLKHSVVNLVGLGIGGLSVFLLYPHVRPQYGLMQILLQVGMIGLPLFTMGANTVVFRFFPLFKDKSSGHHGFLPLLMGMCIAGSALTWLVIGLFWQQFSPWLKLNAPEVSAHLWMAAPLSFFYVCSVILSQYSANFNRIVVPTLLLDFSQKIILPVLLLAVWFGWISLDIALWGLLCHTIIVFVSLNLYLRWLGEWHWKPDFGFITPELRRDMLRFIGFGAFGGFALMMAAKSDILVVGTMSSLDNTGIYAIVAYLAAVIDIPTKGLYGASIALVSKHLAEDNRVELGNLYRKVSINLLVAGLLIFGVIWVSVDSIFDIIPKGDSMRSGKYVLLFIGLSRIVEMGTGLNNYLVYYSKYYIYSVVSLGLLAFGNVALSIYLIPIMGITGAAVATLCSITGYNLVSLGLVQYLFGLQPFSRRTLYAVLLALLSYGLAAFIPGTGYSMLDLLMRSGVYGLVFSAGILVFKVSPDLNDTVRVGLKKIGR